MHQKNQELTKKVPKAGGKTSMPQGREQEDSNFAHKVRVVRHQEEPVTATTGYTSAGDFAKRVVQLDEEEPVQQ